jgi:hypothetical protein
MENLHLEKKRKRIFGNYLVFREEKEALRRATSGYSTEGSPMQLLAELSLLAIQISGPTAITSRHTKSHTTVKLYICK